MNDIEFVEGHTPGPWRLNDKAGIESAADIDWPHVTDEIATWYQYGIQQEHEAHANARLIAQAPALQDEVKRLRKENRELREHGSNQLFSVDDGETWHDDGPRSQKDDKRCHKRRKLTTALCSARR
jgi:hypothetical protein